MMDTLFNRIEKALEAGNLPCKFFPADEECTTPLLLVDAGPDQKGRQRFLSINLLEQELGQSLVNEETPPLVLLEFEMEYPFSFDPKEGRDVGSLLHYLNRQVKMGGFQMDEAENRLFFRYTLILTPEGITDLLILSVTGVLFLLFDLYAEAIEAVADGSLSFDQLILEAYQIVYTR